MKNFLPQLLNICLNKKMNKIFAQNLLHEMNNLHLNLNNIYAKF